jgi:hypothetical protein
MCYDRTFQVFLSARCGRRCPTYSESKNAMQQVRVAEAVMPGRRRKFLALCDFGVGIRFKEIWNAVRRKAKVDAGVSIKLQRPVDPFR